MSARETFKGKHVVWLLSRSTFVSGLHDRGHTAGAVFLSSVWSPPWPSMWTSSGGWRCLPSCWPGPSWTGGARRRTTWSRWAGIGGERVTWPPSSPLIGAGGDVPGGRVRVLHLLEERGQGGRRARPFPSMTSSILCWKCLLPAFIQVNDIRPSEAPKEEKFKNHILKKHGDNWREKVDI